MLSWRWKDAWHTRGNIVWRVRVGRLLTSDIVGVFAVYVRRLGVDASHFVVHALDFQTHALIFVFQAVCELGIRSVSVDVSPSLDLDTFQPPDVFNRYIWLATQ